MAFQNIAALVQVPELDPLVPAQRQAQIQALADQQQQRGLALQQARQAQADDAAVRAAYGANPTDAGARLRALAGASPRAYAAEQKSQSDFAKANAETEAKRIDTAKQRIQLLGSGYKRVSDNPTMENALGVIQFFQSNGLYTPEQAAEIAKHVQDNPNDIKRMADEAFAGAIDAEKQLPKIEKSNLGGSTVLQAINPLSAEVKTVNTLANTQSPESVATNATAIRGQNMTSQTAAADRTLREKLAGNEITSREKIASDRSATEKPMTEFQGKSAGYADRALEADTTLNSLKYDPAAINSKAAVEGTPLVGGILGAATNALLSTENQQAEQAQRNFINAVLRQESGAAISQGEFENARKQYFPQPNDKPEQIAQKAANRKTVIAGLQRSAGPSYKAPGGSTPVRGSVEDGYRFKGGNPADANSWEKI